MRCKNCDTKLSSEQKFCPDCGAKVIYNRLSIKQLSGEFIESFWSIESNKPVLTFIDLFKKPAQVIDGYINGLRKKYINPFGYFTIALTLTGIYTYINLKYFPEYLDNGIIKANDGDRDISRQLNATVLEYINLITFLLIPIITLISKLVFFKNKRYNLAEHLIIQLYTYSQIHIITSILVIISFVNPSAFKLTNLLSLPLYVIYYSFVFQKLYDLRFWQIFLKTLLFITIFIFLMIILMIVVFYFYSEFF